MGVAVPVRGAGCILKRVVLFSVANIVAVPVRGAGCIVKIQYCSKELTLLSP